MRQTQPVALFHMPQSELILTSAEKHNYLVRDATDVELDGAKQETTNAKLKVQARAITELQALMGIVGTVHDVRSASYKMFGSAGLATGPEAELYVGLLRVVRVGRAHLAE